jgi:hypothetical protein
VFEVTPQILDFDKLAINMGGTTRYLVQFPKRPMAVNKHAI